MYCTVLLSGGPSDFHYNLVRAHQGQSQDQREGERRDGPGTLYSYIISLTLPTILLYCTVLYCSAMFCTVL